ncbi:uncharacterized protein LOC141657616 [Silene latifolia]|uniref:uncharacterized protein LOC141657616 n=1 Tax=Silene latifolia TaxID=37657 RepID=UPI003D77CB4E
MLSVKLVRSLVLGENISTPSPTTTHHHDDTAANQNDDDDDHHHHYHHHHHHDKLKKKKMPMLLFTPTRELITDTFRLATIARDLGMDFYPNSSLSHLLFSWPSSSSPSPSYPYPSSSSNNTNHRTSVSSQTSTFTHTSSSTATTSTTTLSANTLQNDAVPIPFPSLSTNSSISLLRSFVSLSKGVFKLVFFDLSPNPNSDPIFINYYHNLINYDAPVQLSLFSRVSGKRVKSIDDLSTELAGKGWSLFRSPVKKKSSSSSSSLVLSTPPLLLENSVYLFRKMESNRVRVKAGGGGGEGRVRELRLPAIDFEKEVNLRVLLYILLMTDDVFYLA